MPLVSPSASARRPARRASAARPVGRFAKPPEIIGATDYDTRDVLDDFRLDGPCCGTYYDHRDVATVERKLRDGWMRRRRTGRRLHDPACMVKTSVAGVTPPATDPHASVAIIAVDRVAASLGRTRKSARVRKEATCPPSIIPLPDCDPATARMSRRLKSP